MATDGDKNNKQSISTSTHSASYGLRSRAKSVSSPDPRNDVFLTPTKQNIKPSITITPSTPSSKTCAICRGVDELRNYKLREAINEFSTNIDAYKELTKSLNDNNSTLNHALDTVKHYILHIEPKQVNDSLHKIDNNLSTVKDKIDSLHEDYVSKLTDDTWMNFKNTLTQQMGLHIPKITIKYNFNLYGSMPIVMRNAEKKRDYTQRP